MIFKIIIINLWDFNIRMGNIIEHRRPDMIIIDKTSKKTQIIDFTIPADLLKIENYQDLKRELQKLWNLKTSCSYCCTWKHFQAKKCLPVVLF